MEGLACIGVLLAIFFGLAGPAALIISVFALNKISALEKKLTHHLQKPAELPLSIAISPPLPIEEEKTTAQKNLPPLISVPPLPISNIPPKFAADIKKDYVKKRLSLEIFIGTQALAIAGSIAVLAGVIIGLKYLYDMKLITPLWRTIIVASCGMTALTIGQITRRKGYDITATATAALGFALLYTADFAAFGFYHLISTNLAFGIAVLITACGIIYAVRLNEITVSFISLLGGFLSPVMLSTGENRPNMLFAYITILIGGAMACSALRKWRSVSRLSFIGMAAIYIGWYYQWYKPAMYGESIPNQMPVAITWLCVFSAIYLVMPILYELLKKQISQKGDAVLITANAIFCSFYLYQTLFTHYRSYLALAALILGIAHIMMMAIVHKRTPDDKPLKLSLLAIGIFLITASIPLYLKIYGATAAFAAEGFLLTAIGIYYRSRLVQVAAFASFALGIIFLFDNLPLHKNEFRFIINTDFGSWVLLTAALYAAHLLYRGIKNKKFFFAESEYLAQIAFCMSLFLFFAAAIMEWYGHTEYNLVPVIGNLYEKWFEKGAVLICSVFAVLFLLPIFSPKGFLPAAAATVLLCMVSISTLVIFPDFYNSSFLIFANWPFVISLLPVAALAIGSMILHRDGMSIPAFKQIAYGYGLAIIFFVWLLLTEEIYLYWNYPGRISLASRFDIGQMWISIMWAVYASAVIGVGLWRKIISLRYIGLCFFTIVMVKVFVFDMSTLEKIYRIAGFIVLGFVLIAVSYIYQYLKKTGFFEKTTSMLNGT